MPFSSPDLILFSIFLAINLLVGLRAGRSVKTLREYSIGSKDFSNATIISTIVATGISGGFLFYGLEQTYTNGLYFIIPIVGSSIGILLHGQFLAVRMGEFLNNTSVAEAMGDLYGQTVRVITALSGILKCIGYMAVQFQVISKMITLLLGFESPWISIISISIVIIYSAFGGIRAITFTDVFQFFTFSVFIPMLALIIWHQLKEPGKVVNMLMGNPNFSLKKVITWDTRFISSLGLMLYFMMPGMSPTSFQRIVMARDISQAKTTFTWAAIVDFVVAMFLIWVGVLLLTDNANLDPNKLLNYLLNTYTYVGFKGFICAGILAMSMSTADSNLNVSTVLAINDIIKVYRPAWKESIILIRLFSLLLGLCALALAIHTKDLLKLLLLASSFYMPIVTVPMLLAIFGFRSSTRAVLIGMVSGFITVTCWDRLFGYTGINSVIPGMLANLTFIMGSHYILREKGGWVGIKVPEPLIAARQSHRDGWANLIHTIKHTKVYDYLQSNLPTYEVTYSLFAIYIIGATYASFYTVSDIVVNSYATLYNFIYHSVLILTAAFLTYPAWPPTFKSKRFITFAWPAGIFYILFVVGAILVLMSGFNEVQVMIFLVNLIMAAFLLSWPLMLTLSSVGTLLGYAIFNNYCGGMYYCKGIAETGQFKFTYAILLISSFLIALFRFKQNQVKLKEQKNYLARLYEEKSNELAEILGYREQIIKELSEDEKRLFDDTTAAYIQQIIYRMTDYIRLEVTNINLDQLLLEVKDILKLKALDNMPQLITKKLTKEETINGDVVKIKQLLVNAILYIQEHNYNNEPIIVIVEDAKLGHRVDYIKDYTRQLAALRVAIMTAKNIPTKKDIYMIDQLPLLSQQTRKDKLIENARIIHAHYGYANLDNEHMQVYVLPLNVREVRGKVMELLREPVAVDGEEVKHPMAIQLEKKLIDKIKGKKIDIKTVNKALDTIKKYHAGVRRKSGEPFFTHPIAVALILLEYCEDQDAVVAALLHDTVEDTSLSLIQIKAIFGEEVAFIVSKVTNLEDNLRRVSSEEHENVYRLMNYGDERAAYVKLADRLHNMRTISGHSSLAKQKHIANETLNFFVGLAEKLGLVAVSEELEKLSLQVLGKK
jgi:Na+/proline symporter